jgi:protein-L-isoaspartate(D-aspartate) O-methyltransferase
MQQLDDHVRPYVEALVATLKNEGKLSSPLVEAAFMCVPRHPFIDYFFLRERRNDRRVRWRHIQPSSLQDTEAWLRAMYTNEPLITAYNESDGTHNSTSSSSSPGAMALMLEASELCPGLRVLEIGTGTGYNAGLLASIVGDPHNVFTVEIDADLAQRAQQKLDQVVGEGITVYAGDGLRGYTPGAPYDRILATGSCYKVPLAWLDQLRPGGIILMNLRGHLGPCAFLKVVKVGPQRAAHGTFLSASDFMELHDADSPSRKLADLVAQYFARPVTTQMAFACTEFDPSLLWDDHRLDFLLQLSFPHMYLTSVHIDPIYPSLIDMASDTMLVFRQTEQKNEWVVEIKGQEQLWHEVAQAYRLWVDTGKQEVSGYLLEVDEVGNQSVILASRDVGHGHCWTLS